MLPGEVAFAIVVTRIPLPFDGVNYHSWCVSLSRDFLQTALLPGSEDA